MKKVYFPTAFVARTTLLGLFVLIGASCSSNEDVAFQNYEKLPSKPSSKVMRSVLKTVPYTRKRAFYGNYGGSGCSGGEPTDKMDEYFRRHDVVYTMAKSTRTMRLADKELVKALKGIEEKALTECGREYRKRAIKFMESSASAVIGKPISAVFRRKEPLDSCFSHPDSVRLFFAFSYPRFPGSQEASLLPVSIKAAAGVNEVSKLAILNNQ
jgi:hypothetical protein